MKTLSSAALTHLTSVSVKCLLVMSLVGAAWHNTLVDAQFRSKLEIFPSKSVKVKGLHSSPIYYVKLAPVQPSRNQLSFTNLNFGQRKNSNLYKLPLKFISNAKPVDIIQGINQPTIPVRTSTTANSRKKLKHSSVYYLPTKFVSNAKPIKPIILKKALKKKKYSNSYYSYLKVSNKI